MDKKNITIIELGGTICSTVKSPTHEFYNSSNASILSFIKEVDLSNQIDIKVENFLKKISHEFTIDELIELSQKIQNIVESESCDGLVIVMGTNALEDIAYFVGLVVNSKKPIVFTGAHFPQNSLHFDGKKNLYNALLIASSNEAHMLGVLVTFNDYVVTARDATKSNPGMSNNFSFEGNGIIGHVVGNSFSLTAKPIYKHTYLSDFFIKNIKSLPRVALLYAHIGMDDLFIKASRASGVRGIVSAGYGKGYQTKNITESLRQLVLEDIVVVRCARAGIGYTNVDPSYDEENGFIVASTLSPHKCSLLLSIALSTTNDRSQLQKIFKEY